MRKLTKKEINKFKKMIDDIDKKISELCEQVLELDACKKGLQSFVKTKKAYSLEDIKKRLKSKSKKS